MKHLKLAKVLGGAGMAFLAALSLIWYTGHTLDKKERGASLNPLEQGVVETTQIGPKIKDLLKQPALFDVYRPTLLDSLPPSPVPLLHLGQDALPLKGQWLFGRYNYREDRYEVCLQGLENPEKKHCWQLAHAQARRILDSCLQAHPDYYEWMEGSEYVMAMKQAPKHPLLLPGGRLVMPLCGDNGPLVCLNRHSEVCWVDHRISHHSLERDAEGNIWFCSFKGPLEGNFFWPFSLVKISPEGEVLLERRLTALFRNNPQNDFSVLNDNNADRYHLNDIEPVRADGPFWEKGDVLLSLRNSSAVVLYRPRKDSICWARCCGWSYQHDVEILDDSTLSVFDNNLEVLSRNRRQVDGCNALKTLELPGRQVGSLFEDFFRKHHIATDIQGRGQYFPRDSVLMVEATMQGQVWLKDLASNRTFRLALPAGEKHYQTPAWVRVFPGKSQAELLQ